MKTFKFVGDHSLDVFYSEFQHSSSAFACIPNMFCMHGISIDQLDVRSARLCIWMSVIEKVHFTYFRRHNEDFVLGERFSAIQFQNGNSIVLKSLCSTCFKSIEKQKKKTRRDCHTLLFAYALKGVGNLFYAFDPMHLRVEHTFQIY